VNWRFRNSNSKFETGVLTSLVTLPRAHIIEMRTPVLIPFPTFWWAFTTKVKPAALQDLVKYCWSCDLTVGSFKWYVAGNQYTAWIRKPCEKFETLFRKYSCGKFETLFRKYSKSYLPLTICHMKLVCLSGEILGCWQGQLHLLLGWNEVIHVPAPGYQ
jgi:hypothetical protein